MTLFSSLKHEDTQKLGLGVLLVVGLSLGAALVSEFLALWVALLSMFVIGSLFVMHYFREGIRHQQRLSEHIQDLQFLQSQLDLRKPLPYLTGWSASPALASRLHSLIVERRPLSVLELGSGVSTIVMAYAVEKNGVGHVVSIDHDEAYAQKTKAELKRHGLDHAATVVYAPLVSIGTNGSHGTHGTPQLWYDLSRVSDLASVDLLVVDGPPRHTGKDARLPAVELLKSQLSSDCVVVIDDANRSCEMNSVKAWSQLCDPTLNEDIPCEKGVSVRYLN